MEYSVSAYGVADVVSVYASRQGFYAVIQSKRCFVYADVMFRAIIIAGMPALAGKDSAAWNLGRWETLCFAPVVMAMVICRRK